jgi:hypothetical protein
MHSTFANTSTLSIAHENESESFEDTIFFVWIVLGVASLRGARTYKGN